MLGADERRHAGVPGQLPVLTMYRHEEPRLHEGKHQFQLFLAAVAGDVDVLLAVGDDVGAPAGDVVHHPADGLLVAGDDPGREDDDVVRVELDVPVVVDGDAGQGGQRLALRAGAEAEDVLRRVVADVACRESGGRGGIFR